MSAAPVLIRVKDVQNTPPVFVGAMSGRIMEDAPVGSLVMLIEARDGDLGIPRPVQLSIVSSTLLTFSVLINFFSLWIQSLYTRNLISDVGDAFHLNSDTGRLTTARPLDREVLGSVIKLLVKAEEQPREDEPERNRDRDILETTANISILIDDVKIPAELDFFSLKKMPSSS